VAVPGEDDVDSVVLAIGPGDAEEQQEPPPESELALLCELAVKDERPPELLVVDAPTCGTPFTNTSKVPSTCPGSSTWLRCS
jgi:hypothetical protein